MQRPLADIIRPEKFDDVFGQEHLTSEKAVLRRMVENGAVSNMVFFGPSGTGKTTLAKIIASKTNRKMFTLNATSASLSDIKEIAAELDTLMTPNGILLYLDEIQYFNKKQQQSLLEYMENGKIVLIAATTENPYFYVYNALLSRSTVFEFYPVSSESAQKAVDRAFNICSQSRGISFDIEDGVVKYISAACCGDVRKAVNAVEALCGAAIIDNKKAHIKLCDAEEVLKGSSARYDRDGDDHFDLLSAFHKSLRGSDPDAAIHYLACALSYGDMAAVSRRMLAMASEDVGLAYPQAAAIVNACVDSAFRLGLPEARLPLAQAAILLATAPKSNSVCVAIDKAMANVQRGKRGEIPTHLRDTHYAGAAALGRGNDYKYPHNFKNNWVSQQYMPDAVKDEKYYLYGDNKLEKQAKEYWDKIKNTSE